MGQVDDLKLIKKYYGENMMHLCRTLFPTILETSGLLFSLLEKHFAYSKFLYDDIVNNNLINNFKNFIYCLIGVKKEQIVTLKTPQQLLKKAGYILYECKTEKDIQSFRKYYKSNEELCTFDGNRLSTCHVFFAVKENVHEFKREDFSEPKRQDNYGTSVISIQFSKGEVNTLSIKNRYNHTVRNPDATFSNNLENIVGGLTKSFERYYHLNINQNNSEDFELPGYVLANDGKFYKYNYEINNIYYCPNNIIIDNFEVKKDYQEKEKYILGDYFLIDLVNKKVKIYDEKTYDSFIDGLKDIDKIDVIRDKQTGNRFINIKPSVGSTIIIELDKFNRIIGYKNNNQKFVSICFLMYNEALKKIEMNELIRMESLCLRNNKGLKKISFPKIVSIGDLFLEHNDDLLLADFPSLKEMGYGCFNNSWTLDFLNAPKLKKVSDEWDFYHMSFR